MNGMKHGMTAFLLCGMLASLSIGGCGAVDEAAESGSVPVREREAYDLAAEKWKAYGEIKDCDEAWSALGYWDDLDLDAAAAGTVRTERYTASEGQDFYILVSDRESEEQGGQSCYLTRIDMLSLAPERTELQLGDAGGLTAEEAAELAVLTDAMEQGQAELAGLDVLDGKPCLFACRWDDGELAGVYGLQLGEDGKPERMTDLLPGLAQSGALQEQRQPTDFARDGSGNYFIVENGEGGKISVLDGNGEFLVRMGASEKPESLFFCTGRLPDGSPVFESGDPEAEILTMLCFDGEGEKILYRGQGNTAQARYFGEAGEMLWLDYGGILRWNASEGSCERFYRNHGLDVSGCEAIWESDGGEITIAFYDGSVTSLYRLGQGAEEKVQIRIAAIFGGEEWKEYAAEYCRKHPDTEITVECGTPGDTGGVFTNQVMAQILSGKGPDILIVNRGQMEMFQERGALADLSAIVPEEIREQIFECVLQQGTIGESLYGIAGTVSVSTLLVSEEIWAGENWSAEDVLGLLEERESRGEPCDRWVSLRSSLTADQMLFYLALMDIGSDGSTLVDLGQGKCSFDTPEFIRLLEACKKYGEIPGERGNLSEEECLAELEAGKALAFPAEGDLKGFSRAMAMCGEGYHCVGYPTDSGCGSRVTCYQFAAMSAETEHSDTAADFLNDLWSAEAQKGFATSAVRRDILTEGVAEHHPAFDGAPAFLLSEQNVISLEGKPDGTSYLQEYMELLDKGKPESWWTTELRGIVQEEAGAFFTGDRSASATAEIIQNRVQNYLDERK